METIHIIKYDLEEKYIEFKDKEGLEKAYSLLESEDDFIIIDKDDTSLLIIATNLYSKVKSGEIQLCANLVKNG